MAQNNHIRERLDEILAKASTEAQQWNARRAAIQGEFIKELDEEKIRSREGSIAGTGSVVGTPAASVAGSVMGDDAVMVESPSGKKKKKGKKSAVA
jgi:translocation protein SEC66